MAVTPCTCKKPTNSGDTYLDFCMKMIGDREKYNWPRRVQIEFEKADMVNDTEYFKKNCSEYHAQFAAHAIVTKCVFEWTNFHGWLQENQDLTGVRPLLQELEKDCVKK